MTGTAPAWVLGQGVVAAIPSEGGHTQGWRGIVKLDDSRTAFVKIGGDSVRRERRIQHWLAASGASHIAPQLLDFEERDQAMLVLEDLSGAAWPPPYPADTSALFETLADLASVEAPSDLERLEDWSDGSGSGWARVSADPRAFLSLGVCSAGWLEANVDSLIEAENRVDLRGDALVHNDVWSANLCFRDGRAILIDWATAARGNPDLDVAFAILSVLAEGGTTPDRQLLTDEGAWAARMAGHNAVEAALPLPTWARVNSTLRLDQLGDLRVGLAWAARALGLEPVIGTTD